MKNLYHSKIKETNINNKMEERIHLFSTETEFNAVYNGPDYEEPWVSLIEANGRINFNKVGPEPQPTIDVVDFGLSSGTLWAKYNLGATDRSGYGDYFQWADIYPTSAASWNNYRYGLSGSTKYNTNDNLTLLDGYDDAAFVTLGEGWHTPTNAQIDELLANTNSAVTTDSGVSGIKLTSKTDSSKSIFFPFGGQCLETGPQNFDGFGVWSENLDETLVPILNGACLAGNDDGNFGIQRVSFDRGYGINVRPVSGGTFTPDSTRITQRYGGVSKILNNKTDHYFITYDYSNTAFVELGLIQERIDYTTGKIAYYTQKVNGSMKIREDVHVTPNVGEWYMFLNYNNHVSGATPYKLIPESTGSTTTGNTTLEYIVFKGGFNPSTSAYSSTQTLYGLTKKIVDGTVTEDYPGIITNGHMYKSVNELKADSSTYTSVYNESFKIQNKDTYWRNPSMPEPWKEHDYIEVGGLAWSTCNLGATASTDNGGYYSWSETTTKSNYTSASTSYHGIANPQPGTNISGDETYDAAAANWGNGWRMPTSDEFQALINAATSSAVTNTAYTLNFSGGKQLVFPRAGIMDGTSTSSFSGLVCVYCSDVEVANQPRAFMYYPNPQDPSHVYVNGMTDSQGPYGGCSIRPVHALSVN